MFFPVSSQIKGILRRLDKLFYPLSSPSIVEVKIPENLWVFYRGIPPTADAITGFAFQRALRQSNLNLPLKISEAKL